MVVRQYGGWASLEPADLDMQYKFQADVSCHREFVSQVQQNLSALPGKLSGLPMLIWPSSC